MHWGRRCWRIAVSSQYKYSESIFAFSSSSSSCNHWTLQSPTTLPLSATTVSDHQSMDVQSNTAHIVPSSALSQKWKCQNPMACTRGLGRAEVYSSSHQTHTYTRYEKRGVSTLKRVSCFLRLLDFGIRSMFIQWLAAYACNKISRMTAIVLKNFSAAMSEY